MKYPRFVLFEILNFVEISFDILEDETYAHQSSLHTKFNKKSTIYSCNYFLYSTKFVDIIFGHAMMYK